MCCAAFRPWLLSSAVEGTRENLDFQHAATLTGNKRIVNIDDIFAMIRFPIPIAAFLHGRELGLGTSEATAIAISVKRLMKMLSKPKPQHVESSFRYVARTSCRDPKGVAGRRVQ